MKCSFLSGVTSFPFVVGFSTASDLGEEGEWVSSPDADGFIPIFDGRSLEGWEKAPAREAKAWEVKGGAIVGDGDKGRGSLIYENREHRGMIQLQLHAPGMIVQFKDLRLKITE